MIHINDIPLDLFLDYFNETNTSDITFTPAMEELKAKGNLFLCNSSFIAMAPSTGTGMTQYLFDEYDDKFTSVVQKDAAYESYMYNAPIGFPDASTFYPFYMELKYVGNDADIEKTKVIPVTTQDIYNATTGLLEISAKIAEFKECLKDENEKYKKFIKYILDVTHMTFYTLDGTAVSATWLFDKDHLTLTPVTLSGDFVIFGTEYAVVKIGANFRTEYHKRDENHNLLYKDTFGFETKFSGSSSPLLRHQHAVRMVYNDVDDVYTKFINTAKPGNIYYVISGETKRLMTLSSLNEKTTYTALPENSMTSLANTRIDYDEDVYDDIEIYKNEYRKSKEILNITGLDEITMNTGLATVSNRNNISGFCDVTPVEGKVYRIKSVYTSYSTEKGKIIVSPRKDAHFSISVYSDKIAASSGKNKTAGSVPIENFYGRSSGSTTQKMPPALSAATLLNSRQPSTVSTSSIIKVNKDTDYNFTEDIKISGVPFIIVPINSAFVPSSITNGANGEATVYGTFTLRDVDTGNEMGTFEVIVRDYALLLRNTLTKDEYEISDRESAETKYEKLPEVQINSLVGEAQAGSPAAKINSDKFYYAKILFYNAVTEESKHSPLIGTLTKHDDRYDFAPVHLDYHGEGLSLFSEYIDTENAQEVPLQEFNLRDFTNFSANYQDTVVVTGYANPTAYTRTPVYLRTDTTTAYSRVTEYIMHTGTITGDLPSTLVGYDSDSRFKKITDSSISRNLRGDILDENIYERIKNSSIQSILRAVLDTNKNLAISTLALVANDEPNGNNDLLNMRTIAEGYYNVIANDGRRSDIKEVDAIPQTATGTVITTIMQQVPQKKPIELAEDKESDYSEYPVDATPRSAFEKILNYKEFPTDFSYYDVKKKTEIKKSFFDNINEIPVNFDVKLVDTRKSAKDLGKSIFGVQKFTSTFVSNMLNLAEIKSNSENHLKTFKTFFALNAKLSALAVATQYDTNYDRMSSDDISYKTVVSSAYPENGSDFMYMFNLLNQKPCEDNNYHVWEVM